MATALLAVSLSLCFSARLGTLREEGKAGENEVKLSFSFLAQAIYSVQIQARRHARECFLLKHSSVSSHSSIDSQWGPSGKLWQL